ncbi:MAG: hypothetical protein HZB11_00090 [Candidatus Yonathbacteria bacterium]|nr:hypothetical protein [Candidatus Yonathbacteria bacterium]
MKNLIKILKWMATTILAAFILLMILRLPFYLQNKKTDEQVAKIHATKLTIDDVMGVNLPPDPGAEADKTIAGIDANKNGIRDDVELAIFKEYPNSAKTRAVLLQYALALQMELTQPFENEKNVTEVVREQSRAHYCVGEITSRDDMKKFIEVGDKLHGFVEDKQRNTQARVDFRKDFVKKVRSYSESENDVCDIKLSMLPN